MTNERDQTSRARILDAARGLFADKGFDGARVDEIARRAGVNKALIYYYFASKEAILEELFRGVVTETLEKISALMIGVSSFDDEEQTNRFLLEILDFLEERRDVIRIMLMESMKHSPVNNLVFELVEAFLGSQLEKMEALGLRIEDRSKVMVTEFFTGIMPVLNYLVYREMWVDQFGIDEDSLRRKFLEVFRGTHVAFTRKSSVPMSAE